LVLIVRRGVKTSSEFSDIFLTQQSIFSQDNVAVEEQKTMCRDMV
jgi:hypothetical protein